MKSYLQGIITGGVFVFAIFIFMGGSNVPDSEPIGRYEHIQSMFVLDTKTGNILVPIGKNDSEYDTDKMGRFLWANQYHNVSKGFHN